MDKNDAIKIARRYVDSINQKYQVENAILFGSFAKGTNHPDSDIDVAIIFNSVDDMIDMQIELMQMRSDDDLLIEPHPFKKADFLATNPIVAEIMKNGIEIINFAA
ncbi:MAG: nucleotidyltransferase domain-containing protein [Bacteroidota bacterium]